MLAVAPFRILQLLAGFNGLMMTIRTDNAQMGTVEGARRLDFVPAALQASALRKRYGATEALAGVDVQVDEGELVGLLGPNGAGKSTLVKIACGLVRPSAGTVSILGAP